MLFLNSVRVAPGVRSALAVACVLALSGAGMAQAQDGVEPVVVTASRMPQLLQTAPIGATVITSEQIQRSGVVDANEAIRKLAGVPYKSDLGGGREYSLDIRGFGGNTDQNTVVMVDGIRVSENELAPARLTAIPLEMIDRIEIIRGGSSVMWGEGASAGVINVILKHPEGDVSRGNVSAAVASFGGRDVTAFGQWARDHLALDASVKRVRSDGFRDNGAYAQDVADVGLQWADMGWQWRAQVQQENQKARLPGSISITEYLANRRQSDQMADYANNQQTRYTSSLSYQWADWLFQLDAGHRVRNVKYVAWGGPEVSSNRRQSQISPRVAYKALAGEAEIKAVFGLDWQGWDFDQSAYWNSGLETGVQDNRAAYIQTEALLSTKTRISLGWREERVRKSGEVPGSVSYDRRDTLHAGELGVNQTLAQGWDVYGRLASSYRLPNVDENRSTPNGAQLLPQESSDREVGLKWMSGMDSATVRYFRQNTINEISYLSAPIYANANLDPTRRRGVEVEGRWYPVKSVGLTLTWQQLTAKYRAGPNEGKEMTLVAPHSATVRASYQIDDHNSVDVGAQYLASMRNGNDDDSLCSSRVPSSNLIDARYAWTDRVWTIAVSGANLADKKGYNYSYGCVGSAIYPYAGRSVRFFASRQF